jgi:hypothetical protein
MTTDSQEYLVTIGSLNDSLATSINKAQDLEIALNTALEANVKSSVSSSEALLIASLQVERDELRAEIGELEARCVPSFLVVHE